MRHELGGFDKTWYSGIESSLRRERCSEREAAVSSWRACGGRRGAARALLSKAAGHCGVEGEGCCLQVNKDLAGGAGGAGLPPSEEIGGEAQGHPHPQPPSAQLHPTAHVSPSPEPPDAKPHQPPGGEGRAKPAKPRASRAGF